MSSRDRSSSPKRDNGPRPKKQKTSGGGGFKWKEQRPRDEDRDGHERSSARGNDRLERGYRERSPRRREGDRYEQRERAPRIRDERDARHEGSRSEGPSAVTKSANDSKDNPNPTSTMTSTPTPTTAPAPKTKKPKSKTPAAPPPQNVMIVNINDRLGTKAAIPCLGSDSVRAFKAVVAAHIGRQPHEIMLKRQGERPFKDALTLEDYGVSSGVQLDLEVDTGD